MKFYLTAYSSSHCEEYTGEREYPCISLVTDDWDDDFKYETLFRLIYKKSQIGIRHEIGSIKIMKSGCDITRFSIPKEFEALGDEYCSLGQDIDFYKRLLDLFGANEAMNILGALRDCATDKKIYNDFKDKPIFKYSLLRFSEAYKALKEAEDIVLGQAYNNEFSFKYKNKFKRSAQEYEVEFDFKPHGSLPHRINVIIGKNGAGKTNLLSNLASNLSGIKKDNGFIDEYQRPPFSKYIVISYNIFDDFNKPFELDESITNYKLLQNCLNNINEQLDYMLSGNEKDIDTSGKIGELISSIEYNAKELQETLDLKEHDINNDKLNNSLFSYVYCGLRTDSGVITLNQMQENLLRNISRIKNIQRIENWKSILIKVIKEEEILDRILEREHGIDLFEGLSSGESIMLFVITSIIANIEEESLLIFDEPEVHLHPNAVCYFMKMFNELLEQFDSYAIIATHSPLIVQEVPSRYVTIFNTSEDNVTHIEKLKEECFGENISNITNYIFDIAEYESNYKGYLKKMFEDEGLDKEDIMDMFDNKLAYNALLYLNYLYS